MFRFANPEFLYLLLGLPLLLAIGWWSDRRAWRQVEAFSGTRLAAFLTAGNSRWKQHAGRVLLALAYLLLVLGFARPQTGLSHQLEKSRGFDILCLVDTSRSMAATDEWPSRLGRVKRALLTLADQLPGSRLGLVQYAGTAFQLCPFTEDAPAFKLVADSLDTTSLPVPGSNLAGAVKEGLQVFERSAQTGARIRVLAIFTDGENFGANTPIPAIKRAAESGIRTFCFGVGTVAGTPIPAPSDAEPVKPNQKQLTRLDERFLLKVAYFGGGAYARLTAAGQEETRLVEALQHLEKLELYSDRLVTWGDRYPLFAVSALLCLLLEFLLGKRRGKFHFAAWWRRLRTGAVTVVLLVGAVSWAHAANPHSLVRQSLKLLRAGRLPESERLLLQAVKAKPGDPLAEYDLGCIQLLQNQHALARQSFTRALPGAQGKLRGAVLYNQGYAAFYLGLHLGQAERWQEAVTAFREVLLQNPEDEDARYNLELILRAIKKQTKQAAQQETSSQGKNQGSNPGSGADKPGTDRERSEGQTNDQAPPQESQQKSTKRQKEGNRTSTSEDQRGKKQKGMSPEDALRTLRSLEADEQDMDKNKQPLNADPNQYQGPYW